MLDKTELNTYRGGGIGSVCLAFCGLRNQSWKHQFQIVTVGMGLLATQALDGHVPWTLIPHTQTRLQHGLEDAYYFNLYLQYPKIFS